MCSKGEMIATNDYRDFMDFDDREYEFSSNTFIELDMNATPFENMIQL